MTIRTRKTIAEQALHLTLQSPKPIWGIPELTGVKRCIISITAA